MTQRADIVPRSAQPVRGTLITVRLGTAPGISGKDRSIYDVKIVSAAQPALLIEYSVGIAVRSDGCCARGIFARMYRKK